MIVGTETTATKERIKIPHERIGIVRDNRKKPNLARFFGVLPNFDDGLEFQKTARNEWN